jgi:hypothetical protein
MKAVDPTLSNGIIVGRIARTADPAGAQDQTGNGRVNMARAPWSTRRWNSSSRRGRIRSGQGGTVSLGRIVRRPVTSILPE